MHFIHTILLIIGGFRLCYGQVSDYEYEQMPPLFHMDDFDICMYAEKTPLFCAITVQLSPTNNKSKVWNIIQEVIKLPRNYRHDRLRHFICVPKTCPDIPKAYYRTGNGTVQLHRALSECYIGKYGNLGLTTEVTNVHCQNEEPYQYDFYDFAYWYLILLIISIVILSTIYDLLSLKYKPKNTYQITNNKVIELISCFSLRKNWEMLQRMDNSEDNIKCIHGIRVFITLLVVMAHTGMGVAAAPVRLPKLMEETTLYVSGMSTTNGPLIIQTNFVLAGFLLSFTMFKTFWNNDNIKGRYLVLIYLKRYLRLTPALFMIVGYHATLLNHSSRGPTWHRAVTAETTNCRANGWLTLLYINNYINGNNMCLPITWYISSDTQLFLVSLIVLYVALRNKKHAAKILASAVLIGILAPIIDSYVNGYEMMMKIYPEPAYDLMVKSKEWAQLFIPGHANMGSYMQGLLYGYIFYKYKNRKIVLNKFATGIWYILSLGLPFIVIYGVIIFYNGYYEPTKIESALYNGVARNLVAFGTGIFLLGLAYGNGWPVGNMLSWEPLQYLSKLTYCIYLSHTTILRTRIGSLRQPDDMLPITMNNKIAGDIVIAYIVGLMLYLFVDQPVAGIMKLMFPTRPASKHVVKETSEKDK